MTFSNLQELSIVGPTLGDLRLAEHRNLAGRFQDLQNELSKLNSRYDLVSRLRRTPGAKPL